MGKLIVFNMMTLDGFFEGENHSIDWHTVDGEFNVFAIRQLDEAGMLIFGKTTYELMAGYWNTEAALQDDPKVAERMNRLPKIVFSESLDRADWNNTTLIHEVVPQKITEMKRGQEKDIFIFGSAKLCSTFRKLNLIDEYRFIMNPVAIGKGTPFFKPEDGKLNLKLLKSTPFLSGNILLYYEPIASV